MIKEKNFKILSTRVSNAMSKYPGWQNQPAEAEKAWRKYIRKAPIIMSLRLSRPVDLTEVLSGRLDWINFILQFNALKEIYGVYEKREKYRIAKDLNQLLAIVEANQSTPPALSRINERAKQINMQMSRSGLQSPCQTTEREFLSTLGLSGETLGLYDQGKLTVEELLIRQPWLITSV